jgi:hypothetical protein
LSLNLLLTNNIKMYHFIHLSDLHYRDNWEENQGIVLQEFFKDLKKQIDLAPSDEYYLIMSGDFVLAGEDIKLFDKVFNLFDSELVRLNISKFNRFCVPGNHDVERNFLEKKFVEHDAVVKRNMNEKEFNDYIQLPDNIFREKFHNYFSFTSKFSTPGNRENEFFTGVGYKLNQDVSIYCLNTSLCSSGGYKEINDKGFLAIDTRNIHKWLSVNDAKFKILVMHHPIDWLTEWAQEELNILLKKSFNLCLFGHIHSQDYHYKIIKENALVECSAPPLFTNKKEELGYSIFSFSELGLIDLTYRQWTKKSNNFLTGVNFSNTDNGKVIFNRIESAKVSVNMDEVLLMLDRELSEALESFASQPIVWVDPIVTKSNDVNDFNDEANRVPLEAILITTDSLIIKSPPQFGLTCLSRFLIKTAWQLNKEIWIYLDANTVGPHNLNVKIQKELQKRRCELKDVKCIILDSWKNSEKEKFTLLKNLSDIAKDTQIIVMQTIDDINFLKKEDEEYIDREFEILHLLALPRGHIRKVVAQYNLMKHIGEEDGVISKVISDLDVLNIHRTPMNCLTILKVSEKFYDENPVNRTKMLERILIMLFEIPEIPTYKSRPDVTDCEYVLGYFCENLIKTKTYTFSRDDFSKRITTFSNEKLITIEDDLVFDILYNNNIIVKRDSVFVFRSAYWLYYFAAQRMHHDEEFAKYMFKDKNYLAFPEIIEFYTGIDRRREDALKILTADLTSICDVVFEKVGIEDGMNPYKIAKWEPTSESLQRMQDIVGENVKKSSLPIAVKDEYADKTYDQSKPYDQSVNTIFEDYSLHSLLYSIKSVSRALRNSDFVHPEVKKHALSEITRSWEQVSKVLIALTPILADQGQAAFEGQTFSLSGDFGATREEKINGILNAVPNNIVRFFKDDLFSNKLGSLIYHQISIEQNELKRLELILLLIYERPKNWKNEVQRYISGLNKNSFYLFKTFRALNNEYIYSYASPDTLKEIAILIKVCIAKHQFGDSNPSSKISKIPNSVIPTRKINDDNENEDDVNIKTWAYNSNNNED